MKRQLLLLLLVGTGLPAISQTRQDTLNTINKIFEHYQPQNPGCQVAISSNGELIFSKAWGLAELEHQTPYTTETITEAGSISKQFTAAAILLLQQQGKLSVTDDLRKYFPQLPNYGRPILLTHLLHHTSGLREWSDLAALTGWPRTTRAYTNDDVLELLALQQKLNNLPGDEFIYSNSNYVLLALIVEQVSGQTLAGFTRKYIFEPAGMTHTTWRSSYKKLVPNRGIAYNKTNTGDYEICMPNESVYGPGALLTTAEDLLKWNSFYLGDKPFRLGLLTQQLNIDAMPTGAISNYACGLYVDKLKGHLMIYHDGQTAGYVAMLESFPDLHLSIAFLSNTTEFKDSLFNEVTALENLLIKDKETPSVKPELKTTIVPEQILRGYTGWYKHGKTNQGLKVTLQKGGVLMFNNTVLIPIRPNEFKYRESLISFSKPGEFLLTTADKRKIIFTRQKPAQLSYDYLLQFTGRYYAKEIRSGFTIAFKNGRLVINEHYIKDAELLPTYQQAFSFYLSSDANLFPQLANVVFQRNGKQVINEAHVSMSDARDIKFVKQP